MRVRESLLPFNFTRWDEVKGADGGFYLAWRVITFLLVLFGFLALASTGELPRRDFHCVCRPLGRRFFHL